ncbi:urease accessory protein UreF [Gymnodinialimonas hymeniacidonis]|uniref:urease accessory protein UreF n=1 Tax=Gymnodinialimonas hymeniacidonis TaxID=3126508 RepID=UPI0034C62509
MTISDPILTLTQWLSPAYPVGAFAYSHGLESVVEDGHVRDVCALRKWLEDVLRYGAGANDARFIAAAWHAETAEDVIDIDATARAFCPSRERLLETEQIGVAFGKVTDAVWAQATGKLTYPVALGRAAKLQGLPLNLTLRVALQAMMSNLIACAQRLAPIGQTEAQGLLRDLAATCCDVAEDAADGDLSRLSSTAFIGDIASMRHETQYSRIFRT